MLEIVKYSKKVLLYQALVELAQMKFLPSLFLQKFANFFKLGPVLLNIYALTNGATTFSIA